MPLTLSPTQIAFNARGDGAFHRPFAEQVAFLRDKLDLPTEHWDDILKGAHDRGFVVAGALKADLLADFHAAVLKTAAEGKSLQWFKKEFEAIVAKNGWQGWTGEDTPEGRDWRARVIYRTNLTSSHAAGRYAQLTDPELLQTRPYWKYVHNDTVQHPRELHQAWGRKPVVLRHDDPWWQTHYPPNGWGCRCRIVAVRPEEYPGDPAPDDGTWTKTDRYGVTHEIPKGIDYGWDYAPGASRAEELRQLVADKTAKLPGPLAKAFGQEMRTRKIPTTKPGKQQKPAYTRDAIAQQWCNGKITLEPGFDCQREMGVSVTEFGQLIGAPDGTVVSVKKQYANYIVTGTGGPLEQFERLLYKDRDGVMNAHNEEIQLEKSMQGSGLGAHLFAMQAKALSKAGVRFLDCHAAGHYQHPRWNGYYTWPRLGYDANLSAPIKAMLPETLRTANTLLDLMATPEGRAFWKRHGEPMDVVFDLSPGSRSMQVLEAYLTEKGYRL